MRAGAGLTRACAADVKEIRRVYLDYNASAPLLPAARLAMLEALEPTGNASSVHAEGRAGRRRIEEARTALAEAIGARPGGIVFTAGASEAANLALSPQMRLGRQEMRFGHLYVSAIEHPCVLAGGRFAEYAVSRYAVHADGVADLGDLAESLSRHDPAGGPPLVALMAVNNETGVIQPVAQAGEMVHARGGMLLVDAVQAFGRMPLDLAKTGADLLLLSAHKIGGPQGAGALVLANGDLRPLPLIKGGGQELNRRAGTENIAAISGFGAAARQMPAQVAKIAEMAALRDWMQTEFVTISNRCGIAPPVFFGAESGRVANTCCFGVPGIAAETALIGLDLEGIAVSSGSACSSGKVRKSHVLAAMGVDDALAKTALRISFGPDTTREEIGRLLSAWTDIVRRQGAKAVA
jgi:cysteine desulfurase